MASNPVSQKLREVAGNLRTKPTALSDFIPMLQKSADEIDELAAKAAILDWLLTPAPSTRPDRPSRLSRQINIDHLRALMVFNAWGTPEQILDAMRKEMNK